MRTKVITAVSVDHDLPSAFKQRKMNFSGFVNDAGWERIREFDEFSEYRKRRRN